MMSFTRPFTLALALLAAPLALSAQEALTPEPLAADAPTAKQARAVAELLLAGDRTKLDAYFATNGAKELTGSSTFAAEVAELLEEVKTGARTIVRFDDVGQNRVGVALARDAGGSPERAIVVTMEPTAPHRVKSLRLARIQIG